MYETSNFRWQNHPFNSQSPLEKAEKVFDENYHACFFDGHSSQWVVSDNRETLDYVEEEGYLMYFIDCSIRDTIRKYGVQWVDGHLVIFCSLKQEMEEASERLRNCREAIRNIFFD